MKSFLNYAKNRFLYNLLRLLIFFGLGLLASQFLFIPKVNAQVVDYRFMGTTLNNSFSVGANSSSTGSTYFVVTGDSTGKYLVVDLCSTVGSSFTTSVTNNYDGSYTSFHEMYDLNKTCSTGSYNGYVVRVYYLIGTYADSGNGSLAINNTIRFTNNASYSAIFKLISIGLADTIDLSDLTINNQNTIINGINGINGSISNTEQNIKNELNNVEDSINNTITDNFQSCTNSYNLLNLNSTNTQSYQTWLSIEGNNFYVNGPSDVGYFGFNFSLKPNTTYTLSSSSKTNPINIYTNDLSHRISSLDINSNSVSFNTGIYTNITLTFYGDSVYREVQLIEGSVAKPYLSFDDKYCTNKIDSTNDKLDQAEETRKGILGKIGDLISYINPLSENFFVYKLIELLLDALKSLFIPKDGFFSEWFDEFMAYVELKLGFLATPFTLFIDFVESYLNLSSSTDVIINIPDISVPNFEDNILIHPTSFNWSETLRGKESLNTLWQLYLDFIDVFLILNFIGLCESTYNRIFGGNTANYEYYTVEDSYTYDNDTGEVLSSRRNERTTRRKKVDN